MAWTTIAQECVRKYNETEHTVTGFTPRYLLDGTTTTMLPDELKKISRPEDWIQDRKKALENTIKSHKYNKKIFDESRKDVKLTVGDMVFVENGNRLNRKKMEEIRIGPYEIVEKVSNSIYKINTGRKQSENSLFHITKLIPANSISSDSD